MNSLAVICCCFTVRELGKAVWEMRGVGAEKRQ